MSGHSASDRHSQRFGRHVHGILAATFLLLPVMLLSTACTVKHTSVAPGGDSMIVTNEQIEKMNASNAYDIVVRTHSDFLHSRGRESSNPNVPAIPAHVYVDDTYYGDVNQLKDISAQDIEMIRFYQAAEAQYKFGSGHMGGVIQVITKH